MHGVHQVQQTTFQITSVLADVMKFSVKLKISRESFQRHESTSIIAKNVNFFFPRDVESSNQISKITRLIARINVGYHTDERSRTQKLQHKLIQIKSLPRLFRRTQIAASPNQKMLMDIDEQKFCSRKRYEKKNRSKNPQKNLSRQVPSSDTSDHVVCDVLKTSHAHGWFSWVLRLLLKFKSYVGRSAESRRREDLQNEEK